MKCGFGFVLNSAACSSFT